MHGRVPIGDLEQWGDCLGLDILHAGREYGARVDRRRDDGHGP